ncbi:MAG: inositol monophosphatase [Oscillospiraceae bacterium]|nr:inositol monophosphatase [Oscillospiraceae bacterium]
MLERIISIVRRAGETILQARDIESAAQEKSSAADLVTKYDLAVQEFLRRELLFLVPQAGFLGEEGDGCAPDREWVFIVDPIDGTTNFVRGCHHSAISVALARNGVVEYGVVYNPFANELFSAERGRGAWCNGAPIRVSTRDLAHAIFHSGSTIYDRSFTPRSFAIMRYLYDSALDFRRLASAALDLCYVACGRAEVFFECRLLPWDYAAGMLIVEEAGGHVTTLDGQAPNVLQTSGILAVNDRCAELWQVTKSIQE